MDVIMLVQQMLAGTLLPMQTTRHGQADMLEKEAVRTVLDVSVHTKRTYLHNVD